MAKVRDELYYYRALLADADTPRVSKWLLALAIAYLVSPIDLIPDFIPIIGQLDDLVVVPFLVWSALVLIPSEQRESIRARSMAEHADT